MRWGFGEYVREEVYPILQGLDMYLKKGKAVSFNSKAFNQIKLNLREFELHFNESRCENLDLVGTYRPYHFNNEDFGLYIYAEMFGMYLLSIIKSTHMTLREAHTLALDSILTHGSFHYLLERYCILVDDSTEVEELYSVYKKKVYSQTWGTEECLEETLANAFVFKAHPLWDKRHRDFIRALYVRQRAGYQQAHNLNAKKYTEHFQTLESQLRVPKEQTPSLQEYIHKNIPFRYIGLPVYLVNDCRRLEDFMHIVEVLFPHI